METQMKIFFEFLPLVALLSPVLIVAAMNVALRMAGEEGTLLFPTPGAYPNVLLPDVARFAPDGGPDMEEQQAPEVEYRKAA